MTVAKIMRKDVVALRAEEAIEVAWRQMREQRLGALPVTDATDHLLGVVTEHDLLARLAPRQPARWWNTILGDKDPLAADYVKAVGVTVGDLMTVAPITIGPDATIEAAARLMRRHAIDVLAIVADGLYVGLVTRADVLDHLSWPTTTPPGTVSDEELERVMQEGIRQEPWTSSHRVFIEATHGIIRLTGVVASPGERSALVAMARAVPGGAGVEDRLVVLGGTGRRGHLTIS
jgi:CBS domain-containing protein